MMRALLWILLTAATIVAQAPRSSPSAADQQTPPRFGGAYGGLEPIRQRLIDPWVSRYNAVTGERLSAQALYDSHVSLSVRTTFDAITHALMTTTLSDEAGKPIGGAIDLIEALESVRGQVLEASGDRQFRMYVRLTAAAIDTLETSREFRRGADNTVFHEGFPINYRQQGGAPSIQISIANDRRLADIDVDYRSSSFPAAIFNGHLTASNSDVRAGDNDARHAGRWNGFQNWWQNLFSLRASPSDVETQTESQRSRAGIPRAGKKSVDVMAKDFLTAWLIEGDADAASAYVAEQAYNCLTTDQDVPIERDPGMAPFVLRRLLRQTHDAVGHHDSLAGLTVGVRLTDRALKLVKHASHDQFVLYSVPDDMAARAMCDARMTASDVQLPGRKYGKYFGAAFYVASSSGKETPLELLWAKSEGYWKIVAWRSDPAGDQDPLLSEAPAVSIAREKAPDDIASTARAFLDAWLIKRDYDAAFGFIAPAAYACYDLNRVGPRTPSDQTARRTRDALAEAGKNLPRRSLDRLIGPATPVHPLIRLLDHRDAGIYTLTAVPDGFADAATCEALIRNARRPPDVAPVYGTAAGLAFRFRAASGETPVLQTLWRKESGAWRLTAYRVDLP